MPKPVILITVSQYNLSGGAYHSAILKAGGEPLILPTDTDILEVYNIMIDVDGVLLSGGGDICASIYGEESHYTSCFKDRDRDLLELKVIKLACETGKPILGICRGIQLLNVAFGGTLVQDIPSQIHNADEHNIADPLYLHSIDIESDSLLAGIFQTDQIDVNSRHHQSVKALGTGLKVNARSVADGIIEGVESSECKPILGVQCHPEDLVDKYPVFLELFKWLVNTASCKK